MLRKVFATVLVALTLGFFAVVTTEADRGRRSHRSGQASHHSHGHHSNLTLTEVLDLLILTGALTEAQRAEVDVTVAELTLNAATHEEIRIAVVEHLTAFNIEIPVVLQSKLEQQLATIDLTDEQRAEIATLIGELQAADTSADAIRDAVVTELRTFGVEVPTYLLGHVDRLLSHLELTEDQITEIKEVVAGLQAENASKAEIREAITSELEAMGITVPTNLHVKRGHHGGFHYFLFDLTEDQRVEILAVVAEMQVAGSTSAEIREAIKALLIEWEIIAANVDTEEADAAADLAIIDGQIQEAPSAIPVLNRKITSWGAIKSGH